jgi:hypothetical protein
MVVQNSNHINTYTAKKKITKKKKKLAHIKNNKLKKESLNIKKEKNDM